LSERGLTGGKRTNKKGYLATAGIVVVVVLSVVFHTKLTNHWPVIASLEAEAPGWTAPSGNIHVTCNATDRDSDVLSYSWSASGGDISGTGPEVVWTAPEANGEYVVTVVVTDGRGGSATSAFDIKVSSSQSAANSELEQLKTAELGYFGDNGYWPRTSDDLVPNYISGHLKAIYYFDTEYGWVLNAIPTVGGWTGIMFQPGVVGMNGDHGKWVKS
jgi:hypothetical protein